MVLCKTEMANHSSTTALHTYNTVTLSDRRTQKKYYLEYFILV